MSLLGTSEWQSERCSEGEKGRPRKRLVRTARIANSNEKSESRAQFGPQLLDLMLHLALLLSLSLSLSLYQNSRIRSFEERQQQVANVSNALQIWRQTLVLKSIARNEIYTSQAF
jgi:hypothetical protein